MSRTYRKWHGRLAARCWMSVKASFRSTHSARDYIAIHGADWDNTYRVYRCPACEWVHITSQPTRWETASEAA